MDAVFLKLLHMSCTGGVLILAVLLLRIVLKKAPRWSICLLWGLVALRLICPVTPKSNLSIIPSSTPITQVSIFAEPAPEVTEPLFNEPANPLPETQEASTEVTDLAPKQKTPELLTVAVYVWLVGAGVMLLYSCISYGRLKHMVSTAVRLEDNIRQSEYVTSPFVLGMFRPVIYLPYGLKQPHMDHILAHERSHIRRGDHLIKPLGFAILSVHWLNPLVWVAYILLCRDIEAACDERVIQKMTKEQRQSYSATLLRCSVHRRRIAACPVAFGETGVKQRIKGILSYKKPVLWIVIVALLVGAATGVCFLTERPEEPPVETVSPVVLASMEMDALLEELLSHEDSSVVSNPEQCAKAFPEAYQKLLSYDDLALSYFVPKLRKVDIHSYREYMMVYVCAELTGVKSNYEGGGWWERPQQWIAQYDRTLMGDVSNIRVRPGVYYGYAGIEDDTNPYYGEFHEGANDAMSYYVTAEGLTRVYRNLIYTKFDYTHCHQQTVREKVNWQWESANGIGAPQTERAQQIQKDLKQSLKFLEGTDMEELLTNENCLYQPLEKGACIVLSDGELFWLQSDYGKTDYRHIHYVKRLSYRDNYWTTEG